MSSYEDEDEMDLGGLSNAGENNMATYFKEMDRELSATTMGQSFVKKPAKVSYPYSLSVLYSLRGERNFTVQKTFLPFSVD